MKPVVVYVVDYQRKYLVLRYTDPDSGKQVTKSSRTTSQKEALKAAAKWEAEINEGRYKHSTRTSWDEFRIGHELEAVGGLAKATQDKYFTTLQLFETFARPTTLRGITTNIISRFLTHLRSQGASESTIAALPHAMTISRGPVWPFGLRRNRLASFSTITPPPSIAARLFLS